MRAAKHRAGRARRSSARTEPRGPVHPGALDPVAYGTIIRTVADALFATDGTRLVPSEHTRGPWDPRAMHAGAPAALIGRAIERLPAEVPMQVARVTIEVLQPVPLLPLEVLARVERPGRRVQLCSASIVAGAAEVCRAWAWRMRVADLALPMTPPPRTLPGPDAGEPFHPESDEPALHRTAMELRFVRGRFEEAGDAAAWFRLRMPVVAGEAPSPLQRVLAAADFGNGISSALDFLTHLFINTDLTVYLHRQPRGEWVCLDATTTLQTTGVGLAQSALSDVDGPVGRSLQALLVDLRHDATGGTRG